MMPLPKGKGPTEKREIEERIDIRRCRRLG